MKMLTINWNNESDKTKITYHQAFMETGWVAQMDIMRDVINELTNHYDEMLAKEENPNYMRLVK